jgi:hypothetical protein
VEPQSGEQTDDSPRHKASRLRQIVALGERGTGPPVEATPDAFNHPLLPQTPDLGSGDSSALKVTGAGNPCLLEYGERSLGWTLGCHYFSVSFDNCREIVTIGRQVVNGESA